MGDSGLSNTKQTLRNAERSVAADWPEAAVMRLTPSSCLRWGGRALPDESPLAGRQKNKRGVRGAEAGGSEVESCFVH